jgi:hypothetical protein
MTIKQSRATTRRKRNKLLSGGGAFSNTRSSNRKRDVLETTNTKKTNTKKAKPTKSSSQGSSSKTMNAKPVKRAFDKLPFDAIGNITGFLDPVEKKNLGVTDKAMNQDYKEINKINRERRLIEKENFIEVLTRYLKNQDKMYVFNIDKIIQHFESPITNVRMTTGEMNVKQFTMDNNMIQETDNEPLHRESLIETVIHFLPHEAYALVERFVDEDANKNLRILDEYDYGPDLLLSDDLRLYNHNNRPFIERNKALAFNDILLVNSNIVSGRNNAIFGNSRIVIMGPNVNSIADDFDDNGAFYNYRAELTGQTVIISNKVKSIPKGAFQECGEIIKVIIPDSVITIGDDAFSESGITSIIIPNSVTTIGEGVFSECNLTSIVIPDSVISIGERAFYICSNLRSLHIGNAVISIGERAFSNCPFDRLVIPDSVTTIGESAFVGCAHTKTLQLGSSLKTIGSAAFYDCYDIVEVIIPDSVTSIGNAAFDTCGSMKSLTIGKSLKTIGSSVFSDCFELTEIKLGISLETIHKDAFSGSNKIKTVIIPDSHKDNKKLLSLKKQILSNPKKR